VLPFASALHAVPEFWRDKGGDPEAVLMTAPQIEAHNHALAMINEEGWPAGRWRLADLSFDPKRVRARLLTKLERLATQIARGQRVLATGERPALVDELRAEVDGARPADELRVVYRGTPLRCFPSDDGLYEKAWDTAFDLLQCAQLRFGEPVRVAAKGRRFWYVWSTYGDGWVRPEGLTPPLTPAQAAAYLAPRRFVVAQVDRLPIWSAEGALLGAAGFGLRLPLVAEEEGAVTVQVPSATGLVVGRLRLGERDAERREVSLGYPPLTRTRLLDRAFRLLNSPYGWGGTGDQRDCSALMMDLFSAFGLQLPRNTLHQAIAGTRRVEVAALDEASKAQAIDAAAAGGVVLLYMPGHIMLYLGRDGEHLYGFHLFSGYLTPCPGGGETMQRVNRAVVSALDLGKGGSRRSFLQRITRLVVLDGSSPATRAARR